MAKKSIPTKETAPKKNCYLPLLIAGAVGFLAAVLLLNNCPMMSGCPMYSEACPVTSTMAKLDTALVNNDLPLARSNAEKLSEQLERTMPDLAKLADRVASSSTIPQARKNYQALEKKMMSDVSGTYQK
jgi:hypothetical protein